MKLGLYGGAFNPIHRCHLEVAEAVRARLSLASVLFIPTGDPPHKPRTDVMPARHRFEMVRLAIAPYPYFQVSEIETGRQATSYTIDTVRELHNNHPPGTRLIFLIGLDAFLEFPTWKEPQRLLELCEFAVVSRPGVLFKSLEKLALPAIPDAGALARLDAGETETQEFRLQNGRSLWALTIPPCRVSARDIRNRLKRGESVENLLPPAVESYILKAKLMMTGGPSQ
jgi:nicotinate-nucleotide adenylyltransferase